jgi:site-specific DNA-methyltransferase (adenine-specific)
MTCDEWQTPKDLFFALDAEFGFRFDPCCTSDTALCPFSCPIDRGHDGLSRGWGGVRAFVNPPYSRGNIEKWCEKCVIEAQKGSLVVALIPCDCSTKWWQKYVMQAYEIRFLPRRVRFIDPTTGKPAGAPTFGSVIVVWGPGCGGAPPRVRMWDWKEGAA